MSDPNTRIAAARALVAVSKVVPLKVAPEVWLRQFDRFLSGASDLGHAVACLDLAIEKAGPRNKPLDVVLQADSFLAFVNTEPAPQVKPRPVPRQSATKKKATTRKT